MKVWESNKKPNQISSFPPIFSRPSAHQRNCTRYLRSYCDTRGAKYSDINLSCYLKLFLLQFCSRPRWLEGPTPRSLLRDSRFGKLEVGLMFFIFPEPIPIVIKYDVPSHARQPKSSSFIQTQRNQDTVLNLGFDVRLGCI